MTPHDHEQILNGSNGAILEFLYRQYLKAPQTLDADWIDFFRKIETLPLPVEEEWEILRPMPQIKISRSEMSLITDPQMKVFALIQSYRRNGHFAANIDPLGLREPDRHYLSLAENGLDSSDLEREFTVMLGGRRIRLRLEQILDRLETAYCGSLGVEFFYLKEEARRQWLIERLEAPEHHLTISKDIQKLIFKKIYAAEYFERYVALKFPGKKRFSLEGSESLISSLQSVIELSGRFQVHDIVIGMAHRGRLNVLYNICGKDPGMIFAEFKENVPPEMRDGDVKYHLGYSRDVSTLAGNSVHLSLSFNPSHLEVVNPVILGSVRARQTHERDSERKKYLPVLIHGDAAFSGQGINYECLNMSALKGFTVGGSLHIVTNNQIGFTTDPIDGRSTFYATDVARMLQVPIFHVNGDDPEMCYRAVYLAMLWHQEFGTDAFIDLVSYRRLGHNETDEPTFTQPLIYKRIKELPTTVQIYECKLLEEGISQTELMEIKNEIHRELDGALERSNSMMPEYETLRVLWNGFQKNDDGGAVDTSVPAETIERLADRITGLPEGFHPNPKIGKLLDQRREMIRSPAGRIDWGMGEALAMATLLNENIPIRMSGQDVKRGTFSHRHAVLFDTENGTDYCPLNSIREGQAEIEITNSLLSEEAVLGFEFGYSMVDPRVLVIWEAQFGDFANGAQVIIDQFITSCETKWNRMSGLVMLLPHGFEGQGPEHSSARLERYLQLCSQKNIQVCNPTTPAQLFHLIRRQMLRNFRKPLVVMTPKSLLRHPEAVSSLGEFTGGRFREIVNDIVLEPERIRRLLFCTGKIFYELNEARIQNGIADTAIIRIEQLYPFPDTLMQEILAGYADASEFCWVQEEPRNQGAFIFFEFHFSKIIGNTREIVYYGRTASSSPATGYLKVHVKEQEKIIQEALNIQSGVK
jgi:2-oxoglutarate dehydrogenase E1 component